MWKGKDFHVCWETKLDKMLHPSSNAPPLLKMLHPSSKCSTPPQKMVSEYLNGFILIVVIKKLIWILQFFLFDMKCKQILCLWVQIFERINFKMHIFPGETCSRGREYQECSNYCPKTCNNPDPVCPQVCFPECECPNNAPIWHQRTCIPRSLCPAVKGKW